LIWADPEARYLHPTAGSRDQNPRTEPVSFRPGLSDCIAFTAKASRVSDKIGLQPLIFYTRLSPRGARSSTYGRKKRE
jgi:hypothetical protein